MNSHLEAISTGSCVVNPIYSPGSIIREVSAAWSGKFFNRTGSGERRSEVMPAKEQFPQIFCNHRQKAILESRMAFCR